MEEFSTKLLEELELEYSIQTALRREFETADKDRAIQIYQTAEQLSYYEQAEEMKSDIEFEFNIKID
tara:strand:+ start:446 stop:646 length:201 start_codon:yes stop_codon:yes gene_type:complete